MFNLYSSYSSARNTSRLIVTLGHGLWRVISLAVSFTVLFSSVGKAQGEQDRGSNMSDPLSIVQQAHVNPVTVKIPIVDGTDVRFTRLSTTNGLSQRRVSEIVQDDQGFMWFGTQYGLNRYDGHNFKVFVPDPRNPNSLSSVFITALFKDRDGALWVGCDRFLNKFEPATETFARYPVPDVNHVSQDTAGTLWLATKGGLYSLDPATGRIRRYSHDPNDPSSLSSNNVKSSGEDKEGRFWVANSEGLDEFDRKMGRVTLHVPLPEPSREMSFYEDRFGVFWIFHASGNGLAVFDRKTNTLTHYSFREQEPASNARHLGRSESFRRVVWALQNLWSGSARQKLIVSGTRRGPGGETVARHPLLRSASI